MALFSRSDKPPVCPAFISTATRETPFLSESRQDCLPFLLLFLLAFTTQCKLQMTVRKTTFENNGGKGENAGNQHFLLLPTMFSTLFKTLSTIYTI